MFAYYQQAIALRKNSAALCAREIDILHVNPAGRVIAFVRRIGTDQVLVVACLANRPYEHGYVLQTDESRLNNGQWQEVLNSDGAVYGGANTGNFGAELAAFGGRFEARLPACGVVVFRKVA
jgi:1,4-alpha-glucan branching enzyme